LVRIETVLAEIVDRRRDEREGEVDDGTEGWRGRQIAESNMPVCLEENIDFKNLTTELREASKHTAVQ
jgi:hypothetical protein